MSHKKNSSNNHTVNSVPSIVFTPFEISRNAIMILMFLSVALCIYLFVNVSLNNLAFSPEQLNDLSGFVLNLILVIAALGFSIFTLPISTAQTRKEELLLSYIGQSLVITSIAIFSYIISYCPFLINVWNGKVISLYFCVCLFVICKSITGLTSTIIAYFNIRN